jgi:hypothetical protein
MECFGVYSIRSSHFNSPFHSSRSLSFLSSRLIAARIFMNPPNEIYLNRRQGTRFAARSK